MIAFEAAEARTLLFKQNPTFPEQREHTCLVIANIKLHRPAVIARRSPLINKRI